MRAAGLHLDLCIECILYLFVKHMSKKFEFLVRLDLYRMLIMCLVYLAYGCILFELAF